MKHHIKHSRSLILSIAALLVGFVGLVATRLPGLLPAAAPGVGMESAQGWPQANITQLQSDPGSLAGPFTGQVKLDWTVLGVYTDTQLATPMPQPVEAQALPDLGTIDLALQLAQSGSQVTGFVDLGRTLVFTAAATIMATPVGPTPLPGTPAPAAVPLDIGPAVTGNLDGAELQLESDRMSGVIAGVPIQRQFRLTGLAVWEENVVTIRGEYRETIWGYVPKPLTVIGTFKLTQPLFATELAPVNTATVTATPTATSAGDTPTATPTGVGPTATSTATPTATPTVTATPTATPEGEDPKIFLPVNVR